MSGVWVTVSVSRVSPDPELLSGPTAPTCFGFCAAQSDRKASVPEHWVNFSTKRSLYISHCVPAHSISFIHSSMSLRASSEPRALGNAMGGRQEADSLSLPPHPPTKKKRPIHPQIDRHSEPNTDWNNLLTPLLPLQIDTGGGRMSHPP